MAPTNSHDAPKLNGVNGVAHTDVSRQISTDSQISRGSVSNPTFWQRWTSWRYKIAFIMQLSITVQVLLKLNMPIALVCMNQSSRSQNTSAEDMTSLLSNDSLDVTNHSLTQTSKEFHWDSSIEGLILSSQGFLAYVTPSLTDWLSRHFGAKLVMQAAMLSSGGLTLLMPFGARMSPYVLIALRCLVGMAGGVVFPITSELFSWWAPESEKVSMMSFAFLGVNLGNILAGVTSGYLCSIPIDYGWPFIFYINGALTVLWCIIWQVFGSVRPDDHPFISKREKIHIINTRLGMDGHQGGVSPPYKDIARSRPVWGFLLVMASHYFTTMLVFSYLPLYLSTLFSLDVQEIGLLASLGYVARFFGVILWGQLSNLLSMRTNIGPTLTRKAIQCSGFFVTSISLVILGFMEDVIPALCLLMVIMFSQSCTLVSGIVLPLDIAPRYASFLSGLFVTVASVVSVPGPLIASAMTSEGTLEQWRTFFIMVAVVFAFGAFCFLILAKAELQPWAIPKGSSAKDERTRPLTPDLMTRRMTVLSAGPPVSPAPSQQRFNFTLTVESNFGQARADQPHIREEEEEPTTENDRNGFTILPAITTPTTATAKSDSNDTSKHGGNATVPASDHAYSNPAFESTDVPYTHSNSLTSSQANDVKNKNHSQEPADYANMDRGQTTLSSNNEKDKTDKTSDGNKRTVETQPPKRTSLENLRRDRGLKLIIDQTAASSLQDTAEVGPAHASHKSDQNIAGSSQDEEVESTRL